MAFWRKETASIDQKYTYEKLPKYLSRALFPSSGQNQVRFPDPFADGSFKVRRGPCLDKTQKTAVFSQKSVPCAPRLHCFIGRAWNQMDPKDQYLTKIQVLGKIGPFLGQNSNFYGRNQKFWYQHSGTTTEAPCSHCFLVGHGTKWSKNANIWPRMPISSQIGPFWDQKS